MLICLCSIRPKKDARTWNSAGSWTRRPRIEGHLENDIAESGGGESAENYVVYLHVSPSNKTYIGITKQSVTRRWQNGYAYRNNPHFFNAIQKYGWDAFEHRILYKNMSIEQAKEIEIKLIAFFKSNDHNFGYNQSTGGEGAAGRIFSQDTIQRMSDAHKGKKLSLEQREKIGRSNIGRKLTPQHIEIIRKTHTGKYVSEATRRLISERTRQAMTPEVLEKIRAAQVGRRASDQTRQKMSQARKNRTWKYQALISVCLNTSKVNLYSSLLDATQFLKTNGVPSASSQVICKCLSGRLKTAYGMRWGRLKLEDE